MSGPSPVLVVTGLAAEARIIAGDGILCVCSPPQDLAAALDKIAAKTFEAVVSFGLAGGLAPELPAGSLVIATSVVSAGWSLPCTASLAAMFEERLNKEGMNARCGAMASCDRPLLTAYEKQSLHRSSRAIAVDTESHIAAAFAERHALPFAVLRAVCDAADRDLPPLALTAVRPDGRLDHNRIVRQLLTQPGQLLAMPGTALAAARAMRTLRRVRRLLGPHLGLVDLR